MTLQGRTPLECYRDFMASFKKAVVDVNLMDTLSEVSGWGHAANFDTRRTRRIRSPRGRLSGSSRASASFSATINARWATSPERFGGWAHRWGGAGPHDAGGYNNLPHETGFFRAHQGSWDSSTASFSCRGTRASSWDTAIAASMREVRVWRQGEIWRSCTRHQVRWGALVVQLRSHAAELTAGTSTHEGDNVPSGTGTSPSSRFAESTARGSTSRARRCETSNTVFLEVRPEDCFDRPSRRARYGVKVAGENALCRFDQDAYDKIILNCRGEGDDPELWKTGALLPPMAPFTFLRLSKEPTRMRISTVRALRRAHGQRDGTKVREAPVSPDEVLATLWSSEMLTSGLSGICDETSSIRRRRIQTCEPYPRERRARRRRDGNRGEGCRVGGKPSRHASTSRRTTQTREDPRG